MNEILIKLIDVLKMQIHAYILGEMFVILNNF